MPDNGNYQLQTAGGSRICEIVSASESLERTKIATKLYGGVYLMQTVGTPTRVKTLNLRAWSDAERNAVNDAEAACEAVTAKFEAVTASGWLLDAPSWTVVVPGIYETTVKMVVSET